MTSVAAQLLVLLLVNAGMGQAWVSTANQPRSPGATAGASLVSTKSSLSPRSKPLTRWDAQLESARSAHRLKNWTEVQLWCSRVIDLADDWNAVEQAHLRLALAAQKSSGVDGGRRAFQRGVRDCPSSDTLLLAWALMESKIKHSARSRKRAWALLRRAIALNPKKNSKVLKWSVFAADLLVEAAGGAAVEAVEAVRSALSPPPPPPAAAEAACIMSNSSIGVETERRKASRGHDKEEAALATELLALCRTKQALHGENNEAENGRTDHLPSSASSEIPAATPATAVPMAASAPGTSSAAPSARFQELAGKLERTGGGAGRGSRALSGTWRLVFTTCTECDRVLSRTGCEVYQRLTPPIMAIMPTPALKQPAPFRCEVLLRPPMKTNGNGTDSNGGGGVRAYCAHGKTSSPFNKSEEPHIATVSSTTTGTTATCSKATVAYFFRGWADKSPPTKHREGSLLKQHVAARSATVIGGGDNGGGGAAGGPSKRAARKPSPTPPAAVFSALGMVAPGGKGLEKLAKQEVTYVGKKLRIGRTSNGNVYVYERCAWPTDMDVGLMV